MASKYFEVRDCGTLIPVVAVQLDDSPILRRAGYQPLPFKHVIVTELTTLKTYHTRSFIKSRTLRVATNHIAENWDDLTCGQVIDVEFILGERDAPKTSDL